MFTFQASCIADNSQWQLVFSICCHISNLICMFHRLKRLKDGLPISWHRFVHRFASWKLFKAVFKNLPTWLYSKFYLWTKLTFQNWITSHRCSSSSILKWAQQGTVPLLQCTDDPNLRSGDFCCCCFWRGKKKTKNKKIAWSQVTMTPDALPHRPIGKTITYVFITYDSLTHLSPGLNVRIGKTS